MAEARTITLLLRDVATGDKEALDRLMPLVYGELHRIADGQFRRERQGHTLQPTALVHEAYVRLMRGQQPDYSNRSHFLAIASQLMRKILIDHARTRNASKRGGGRPGLSLDEARDACVERPEIMIGLDDALNALERLDPRKARMIEMRYFGGLTAEESGRALSMEAAEVRRELRVAQAWLQRELDRGAAGGTAS
jgi:RNA polymerase sigma factor (TIGR02999 family)